MAEYVVDLNGVETKEVVTDDDRFMALWGLPVRERIVRCRDCKHATIDQGDHDYREPLWCGFHRMDVALDGFCKWGRPKEDK